MNLESVTGIGDMHAPLYNRGLNKRHYITWSLIYGKDSLTDSSLSTIMTICLSWPGEQGYLLDTKVCI